MLYLKNKKTEAQRISVCKRHMPSKGQNYDWNSGISLYEALACFSKVVHCCISLPSVSTALSQFWDQIRISLFYLISKKLWVRWSPFPSFVWLRNRFVLRSHCCALYNFIFLFSEGKHIHGFKRAICVCGCFWIGFFFLRIKEILAKLFSSILFFDIQEMNVRGIGPLLTLFIWVHSI